VIHRKLLIAGAIAAAVVSTACSDTTAPKQVAPGDVSFDRSGLLHVEKDCTAYHGAGGETCTITSSNLKAIEFGTQIIYLSNAAYPFLDTDVVLDPPGPGNNKAFGHCSITLAPVSIGTRVGGCTISGGTGKFTHLHASVDVTYIGGPNYAWDGPYSFSPND
jgi:hypothetical protein